VFGKLSDMNWADLATRVARPYADVADACVRAMALNDEHEWVNSAASVLNLQGDILWQAMCSEWARVLDSADGSEISQAIEDALNGIDPEHPNEISRRHITISAPFSPEPKPLAPPKRKRPSRVPSEHGRLFDQLPSDPQS
jgi:hypothetical protein